METWKWLYKFIKIQNMPHYRLIKSEPYKYSRDQFVHDGQNAFALLLLTFLEGALDGHVWVVTVLHPFAP